MTFHIVTIFPKIFDSYFKEGIVARAMKKGVFDIKIYDLRSYTTDKHRTVDDTPYGGGPGMVLKVEPIYKCIKHIRGNIAEQSGNDISNFKFQISNFKSSSKPQKTKSNSQFSILNSRIILFSAKGKKYDQQKALDYSKLDHLIMICGRYEGVDERVAEKIADEELSVGDYVLTGGEIPAMAVVDSVGRLVEGALGNPQSLKNETFNSDCLVDYPVYTKPEDFKGWKVPGVLLTGNHGEIEVWRKGRMKEKK